MKRIVAGLLFALILQSAFSQQWIQLNPNPTGSDVAAVQMFSNSSGYMCGAGGAWLSFNGTAWIPDYTFPFKEDLNAMCFLSETNGWVATDQGSILHYDGTSWTKVFSDPSIYFLSIHLSGLDNGWAVGGEGAVVKFDGTSWVLQEAITDGTLWTVYCWDATHVWAGGNQELFFYNGIEWEAVAEGAPCSFIDFHFNSLADGVAYTNQPLVYTYNGTNWTEVPLNDGGFDDVKVVSSTDIWAVDDLGSIWHSDGSAWEVIEEEIIPNYGWFNGLDFSDATHGWAVGSTGAIYQYDGVEWTRYTKGFSNWLNGMDYANSNNAWAVGDEGFLYHFDGLTWNTVQSPTDLNFSSIDVVSENDAWAVAGDYDGSKFVRYNGTNWTVFQTINNPNLNAVSMVNANLGWAVTGGGQIFRFDGTIWSEFTQLPADNYLYFVSVAAENNVWAGGYCENRLWHFDGTSWNPYEIQGVPDDFQCGRFWFTSPTDGWVTGRLKFSSPSPGYIFHYDGSGWSNVWEMANNPVESIQIVNDTLGWAVGDDNIVKYNGVTWEKTQHNVGGGIQDVCFADSETGWLCGQDGLFFQYNPNYFPVGISNPGYSGNALRLFPNPAQETIRWKVPGTIEPMRIGIYSIEGKQVKNVTTANCHLSVADLPAGLYLLRATSNSGRVYFSRFLKE